MQLTERDRAIIRLVHRHRFLRSSHIVVLLGASSQPILRRLQLLYHHGYLERPSQQLRYYHPGGSRHIVYGLANKGELLLRPELDDSFHPRDWGGKNRSVGRMFLEHALLVSDVMVALELACHRRGIRMLTERQLAAVKNGNRASRLFRWRVKLGGWKLGIVPDRVFALELNDHNGSGHWAVFFLEADRGTMPVMRKTLSQTSFYRKLLAYEATWTQNVHRKLFGWPRFRVLTVTTNPHRLATIVEACRSLKHGHGLFLFTDATTLLEQVDGLAAYWRGCRGNSLASLLD